MHPYVGEPTSGPACQNTVPPLDACSYPGRPTPSAPPASSCSMPPAALLPVLAYCALTSDVTPAPAVLCACEMTGVAPAAHWSAVTAAMMLTMPPAPP